MNLDEQLLKLAEQARDKSILGYVTLAVTEDAQVLAAWNVPKYVNTIVGALEHLKIQLLMSVLSLDHEKDSEEGNGQAQNEDRPEQEVQQP